MADRSRSTPRDFSVDLMKSLAIFGVLIIHCCVYPAPIGSFGWLSGAFWGSAVRASVPIFLMCTGALFLSPGKKFSARRLFAVNLPRLVAAMLVWAMLYKIYHLAVQGAFSGAALWQAAKETLVFKHEFHFYYLHLALFAYLFLPLLRLVSENASRRLLRYLLALWFAFGILYPQLAPLWPFKLLEGIPAQYRMNMSYAALGYLLLGHYIARYQPKKSLCAASAALGFAVIFGATVFFSVRRGELYQGFFEGMSAGVCLLGAGIFGLCRYVKTPGRGLRAAAEWLSRASFCVFLTHMFFVYLLGAFVPFWRLPPLIGVPLEALAALALSCAVYFVLSHVPLVRRWLI